MKPGDLVIGIVTKDLWYDTDMMFGKVSWSSVGHICSNEPAIIIQTDVDRYHELARVLTRSLVIGWVYTDCLAEIMTA